MYAVGPCGSDGSAKAEFGSTAASSWIEEYPLDRSKVTVAAHPDQQRRFESSQGPLPSRTPWMETHVLEYAADATNLADIAFGQRALDGTTLAPDFEEGVSRPCRSSLDFGRIKMRYACDSANGPQHVRAVATCMASDENCAITLPNRQRRRSVGMGRTKTHGGVPGPGAAKSANQRFQLGCGSVANEGHAIEARSPSPHPASGSNPGWTE